MENSELQYAEDFVLNTDKCVFLTGKAGTGKSTFLKKVLQKTDKNYVVVAPTGVAAINVGGMTIHSFFTLPLTGFIPNNDVVDPTFITNRIALGRHMRYNKEKLRLFRELELLVIDEISMVRSDILDAIDFILRSVRKKSEPFGGTQLLVIGDLFQLSPVVKQDEWQYLNRYYNSAYFYDSDVWSKTQPINIELQKIYRQKETEFIDLLNMVRNGLRDDTVIDRLNENYRPNFIDTENKYIVLTTHVAKAESINVKRLNEIEGTSKSFQANVTGNFSEYSYPTEKELLLKVGAQVMFIKNESTGLYYNGKIGTVSKLLVDGVEVNSGGEFINVTMVKWKNVRYQLDSDTQKIKEEELGTFEQIPLKLAWAVTIHKSQGLTFDFVILDLNESFAAGQMYVALSRCTSLNGIVLLSKVEKQNIITDKKILAFQENNGQVATSIDRLLEKGIEEYQFTKLSKTFDFSKIKAEIFEWGEIIADSEFEKSKKLSSHKFIEEAIEKMEEVAQKFIEQLKELSSDKNDNSLIIERCSKAITYFTDGLYDNIVLKLNQHIEEFRVKPKSKKYIDELEDLYNLIWAKIELLYSVKIGKNLVHSGATYQRKDLETLSEKKKVKGKGSTFEDTLILFNNGKTVEEIAAIRSMAITTIESHISKWIKEGKVNLEQAMSLARFEQIRPYFANIDDKLTDIKLNIPFEVTYTELRYVQSYLLRETT